MKNKQIYFLGIGGIGMSALAQYFLTEGASVHGYDLTPSDITEMLEHKGAVIHFDDNPQKIPQGIDYAVYTPAVPRSNAEFQFLERLDIPMYKRSQVLGQITEKMPAVAVAGTHGKTTTTSMVAHLLSPQVPIAAFIGGIAKNFDDNLVLDPNPVMAVAEADEYDRSFLTLHPSIAIITAMDADHLDIYGTHENLIAAFQQFARQSKTVIIEENVATNIQHQNKRVYGIQPSADYYAYNITLRPNCATFDLRSPHGTLTGLELHANGLYNVLNATAALAALMEESQDNQDVRNALTENLLREKLSTFTGVKRRFDYIVDNGKVVFIDDYAHHPEEMHSFITAVRKIYPDKHITGIFQPHLYSRTRDFAQAFADVLTPLDQVILLPIYPAREQPIPGIDSEYLLSLVHNPNKLVLTKDELLPYLAAHPQEVLLTIGAGDIDRLVPKIKESVYLQL